MHDPTSFLFPDLDLDEWDLDDESDRAELVEIAFPQFAGLAVTSALIVANQILDGEPPVTWETAQRMLDVGLDRDEVMGQLVTVMIVVVRSMLEEEHHFEEDEYATMLAALPLPSTAETVDRLLAAVEARPGITMDEATVEALGAVPEDDVALLHLDVAWETLLVEGPVETASGERLIRLDTGSASRTFTHRLTDDEVVGGCIHDSFDLGALARSGALVLPDGRTVEAALGRGLDLRGPEGWLDHPVGTLLAFGVDGDTLRVDPLDDEPVVDPALVERFRAAYDRAEEVLELPPRAVDVVAELLVEDPATFDTVAPPLSAIADAAGLEVRGGVVSHDDALWDADARAARAHRAVEDLSGADAVAAALRVLGLSDSLADASSDTERDDLVGALDDLAADPEVLLFVANELFGTDEVAEQHGHALSVALLEVATRSSQQAAARWLAAIAAERAGDPEAAEAHLEAGHRVDPSDPRHIDRLAWYASDRGDADRALRLWTRLEPTRVIADDLAVLRRVGGAGTDAAKTPRNAPCWCGSGRKFKQCHLGKPVELDLTARVPWLFRKATGYLFRRGGRVQSELFDLALALAGVTEEHLDEAEPDAIVAAMTDPIVVDLLLVEGDWFRRFLDERAVLLPADEAALAASWVDVPRTVFEVTGTTPRTLVVRDLRTGDELEVRGGPPTGVGAHLLGRALPDGVGASIVGAVVAVPAGEQQHLLEVVEGGESLDVAAALSSMSGS